MALSGGQVDSQGICMMKDFIEAAVATFGDCTEEVRECLRKIIVRGFKVVPVTPSFRETVADAYGVDYETVRQMKQSDLVRLGLLVINEHQIQTAYENHAHLVDQFWGLLLSAEAVA